MASPKRVWDAPTRVFHWLLALLIFWSWGTAQWGHMEWHRWSGYAIVGLLTFRIYWGLVGSSTAQFANFLKGPRAIVAYVRGLFAKDHARVTGHNPLGALSVAALLALLVAQVGFGLFAVDVDGLESGPLSQYVDFDQGRVAAHWHHITFNALLALIALHLAAIAFYAIVKRENLVGPMFTGRARDVEGAAVYAPLWRVLPGLLIAAAAVFAVMKGFKF